MRRFASVVLFLFGAAVAGYLLVGPAVPRRLAAACWLLLGVGVILSLAGLAARSPGLRGPLRGLALAVGLAAAIGVGAIRWAATSAARGLPKEDHAARAVFHGHAAGLDRLLAATLYATLAVAALPPKTRRQPVTPAGP